VTPTVHNAFLEGLSEERLDAATSTDLNVLLLAGPGAGKTHLLTAHAAFLAKQDCGRVVLLTFSRNAAAEMQARAMRHLGDAREARRVVTRTIHAHAFEILKVHGRALGVPGNVGPPSKRLQTRCIGVASQRLGVEPPRKFLEWLDRHRRLGAAALPPSCAHQLFTQAFEHALLESSSLDYGGAVVRATELVLRNSAIRASIHHHDRHILLDEAQDCDPSQLEFLDALLGDAVHLCVAMDPDQSLYGWRQADPAKVEAWARGKCSKEFALTENFRCAPRVHAMGRYVLTGSAPGAYPDEGVVEQLSFSTLDAEARYLLGEVQGAPRLDRVAILARAAWRLDSVRQALQHASVPVWTHVGEWSESEIRVLRALSVVDFLTIPRAAGSPLPYREVFSAEDLESLRLLSSKKRDPAQLTEAVAVAIGVSTSDLNHLLHMAGRTRTLHDLLREAAQGPGDAQRSGHSLTVSTFHGAKGCELMSST
jgi:superfamily I DNA/RNA helicase